MSRRWLVTAAAVVLGVHCFCGTSPGQTPREMAAQQRALPADASGWTWDMTRFLAMDNPREAAQALRAHAEAHFVPWEATEEPGPAPDLAQPAPGIGVADAARARVMVFNGTEFFPTRGIEATLAARAREAPPSDQKVVCLLQFDRDLSIGELTDLLDQDVKIFGPAGPATEIVRLPQSAIPAIGAKPYVRWLGAYKPEYKFDPRPQAHTKRGAFVYSLGGDRPEYRADLARLNVEIRGYDRIVGFYDIVLDAARFPELAEKLWWVKGLVKEPQELIENGGYDGLSSGSTTVTVNYEPDDSRELVMAYLSGYTGSGVTVGIRDTGVDTNHPELAGIFHAASESASPDFHGTHVTGIVAGRPKSIEGFWGNNVTIRGVAPSASVLFRYWDYGAPIAPSYSADFDTFITNHVQISNHSYGFTDSILYDEHAANFDAYCDNENMIIVIAAHNYPDVARARIPSPSTAKNVLTVGAISFVTESALGGIIGERAAYSIRGPTTNDHRLKPDLVAPGGHDYDNPQFGVVSTADGPNYLYIWESDDTYLRAAGTSMAAPHVTGILATMKERYGDANSALMKALLINVTIPLKENTGHALGGYATTNVGYGLANGLSVNTDYDGESEVLLTHESTLRGDWRTTNLLINVRQETKKLCVTLAYNDEEGPTSVAKALRDDLDLTLISPSGKSNSHALANGVLTESPLEKMVIENPESGTWTGQVTFTSSEGFGNLLRYGVQRFALVAHAIYKTPALTLSVPSSPITVAPGASFTLQPTVANSGGWIAAGVTLIVKRPWEFGRQMNKSCYVGNLVRQDHSASPSFSLVAPSQPGEYILTVEADGINREFSSGYPKSTNVTVIVQAPLDFTIAGHVRTSDGAGIHEVMMIGLPGNPQTDSEGHYSAIVTNGWSGTVTPTKSRCTFDPPTKPYINVTVSRTKEDYTGTPDTCRISGHVLTYDGEGLQGASVGGAITDANGYFSYVVPYGTAECIRAYLRGYLMPDEPCEPRPVTEDLTVDIYMEKGFIISGYVRDANGKGILGVYMLGHDFHASTGEGGYYEETLRCSWFGGRVRPEGNPKIPETLGYIFNPPYRDYDFEHGCEDIEDQNYTGTNRFAISGYVRDTNGVGISGVEMEGLDGEAGWATTDTNGFYSASVPAHWSHVVRPTKTGYIFDPPEWHHPDVTDDQVQDYTGTRIGPELTVDSLHGGAHPPAGRHIFDPMTSIECYVTNSPLLLGVQATQYVCVGWIGTGSVPATGETTYVEFTITNDSALTWLWTTNYWLEALAGPHGRVTLGNGWYDAGFAAIGEAQADCYYHFAEWTGTFPSTNRLLELVMDQRHAVTAVFAPDLTTNGTPLWWLASFGLTNSTPDAEAAADADGDGLKTWEEYVAGTNPTNTNSVLQFEAYAPRDGQFLLTWQAVTGRLYCVYGVTNLLSSTWLPVSGDIAVTNGAATVSWSHSNRNADAFFYRVRVKP